MDAPTVMPDAPAPAITSFQFLQSLNTGSQLAADTTAVIGRASITTSAPFADAAHLVATFASDGTVLVGGVPQESGITVNDFTNPVTYTVTGSDGATRDYRVTVRTHGLGATYDFTTGATPFSLAIGDLNGDGKPDLVTANEGANTVSVLLNRTATGSFIPSFTANQDVAIGGYPMAVAIGDLDADGHPDVVVANRFPPTLSVLQNTSANGATTVTFMPANTTPIGTGADAIALGDLDGDGKLDVAVAEAHADVDQVQVLRNTTSPGSAATFASPANMAVAEPAAITLGDFNADGKLDVATADSYALRVMLNTSTSGSVTFTSPVVSVLANGAQGIAQGDFDGDGKVDLAAASPWGDCVSTFQNLTTTGSTTAAFSPELRWTTAPQPAAVVAADFNQDGRLDLVSANGDIFNPSITKSVSVLLNTAPTPLTFSARHDFPASNNPYAVVAPDLNGDHKPDIAVVGSMSDAVSILLAE